MNDVYIIAEAGINHNGSLENAYKLINLAKNCGANAVKFQLFDKNEQISREAPTAPYQKKNTKKKTMLEMASLYDFSWSDHIKLKKRCDELKIDYMASCFDNKSVDFYLDRIKARIMKIASSEIDNLRLLNYVNKRCKEVILSTGMSTIEEIKKAVDVLKSVKKLTLLQCTSLYPTPPDQLNINVIKTLKKKFKLPVGLSDHSQNNLGSILALGSGCTIIEKHFTISKKMIGPDHKISLSPRQLSSFINTVRKCEKILGTDKKAPTMMEQKFKNYSRRGLYASKNIKKNQLITRNCITYKRPAFFMKISDEKKIIGKKSLVDIKKAEALKKNFFF